MNIFADFEARVRRTAVEVAAGHDEIGTVLERLTVEPPRDPAHGDLATNAAMLMAKPLGQQPRDIATRIAQRLSADEDVESAEVAGPGFINLRLHDGFWTRHLATVLQHGADYGRRAPTGVKTNVEYVSANPTGPLHVGHCRGAVVGDALARLLSYAGEDVTAEYYVNDAGAQVGVLARSAYLRYREALGEEIGEIPAGLYPGEYLKPVGRALKDEFGDRLAGVDETEWLPIVRDRTMAAMMHMIRKDLARLGIMHDVFFSERTLHEGSPCAIEKAIERLRADGYVYQGTLPPPKGQLPDDWEDREQTLLRSTEVGDDQDRALVKSSGDFTYFAADVAYFVDKYERGFQRMIYVLGADHGGYVKRLEAVARAVAGNAAEVDVLLCQLVKLSRNGEPVKMSKRSGEFVTLADVVEEVGRDPVRFMMLYRKSDAPLDFDFDKVTEQSKDNPVFYVQYAHARAAAIFRQGAEAGFEPPRMADVEPESLDALTDQGELGLIRKLAEFPRLIAQAADAREPHRVAFYLYDLASAFHAQYNRGKDFPELRFVKHDDPKLSAARLELVAAVATVIRRGLDLVGADAPEEMR